MSRRYKFGSEEKLHFISYSVVFWIDIFTRTEYTEVLIDSWRYCQQHKGLEIYSWVIMTNHVHLIIGTSKDPFQNIVRDMKRHSSTQLKLLIKANEHESRREWILFMLNKTKLGVNSAGEWQFWQQNRPIEIANENMFHRAMEYIHQNPVKAGFVEKEEDWLHSSARDFHGGKGLLELNYIN